MDKIGLADSQGLSNTGVTMHPTRPTCNCRENQTTQYPRSTLLNLCLMIARLVRVVGTPGEHGRCSAALVTSKIYPKSRPAASVPLVDMGNDEIAQNPGIEFTGIALLICGDCDL